MIYELVNKELLEKYAELVVYKGVNVQPGQLLVINSSIIHGEFIRLVTKFAYEKGASKVMVNWHDDIINRLNYQYQSEESLKNIPEFLVDKKRYEIDNKCAYLHIDSSIPENLASIDPEKIKNVMIANQKVMKQFQYYTMNDIGQWCIAALPNEQWAEKVFPNLSTREAVSKLWDAILNSVMVNSETSAIENWNKHNEIIRNRANILNNYAFNALRFENSIGTNLEVGLIKDHIWCGGDGKNIDGHFFNANMPTEEIFTMPDRLRVNGSVVSTKPLSYSGKLIDSFKVEFKDGKAIKCEAKQNQDVLENLINFDEGSAYLGEVALISYQSPISLSNILFYDTLFDENASCHLAFGRAYPTNLKDGTDLTEEQLLAKGSNVSMVHVDFMFGSQDMNVYGIKEDGSEVQIFKDGNFII